MILNGRVVVDVEIEGVDSRDYPDFCDAYFSYAVYKDTGYRLSDEDLTDLTEQNPDVVNQMAQEYYL
jgi:hypothetical protein